VIITKQCPENQPGCKGSFIYDDILYYKPETCNNFRCALVHRHPELKNTLNNEGGNYSSKIKEDSYPQAHKAEENEVYYKSLYFLRKFRKENKQTNES